MRTMYNHCPAQARKQEKGNHYGKVDKSRPAGGIPSPLPESFYHTDAVYSSVVAILFLTLKYPNNMMTDDTANATAPAL